MAVKFEMKSGDIDALRERCRRVIPEAEKTINEYLANRGTEKIIKGITEYTPVSNREKKHAKDSKPYKGKRGNMKVIVSTKPAYGYLYFPDAGEGTSRKKANHEGFMQEGVEAVYENVVNELLEAIERIL